MEPNITLIWFVHPQWFQKMGAFSRRENLPVFVEWCETAFKLFGEASAPTHTGLWQPSCAAAKKGLAVGGLQQPVDGWPARPWCGCPFLGASLTAAG